MGKKKYKIGIDLGGTRIKAGVLNEKNEILGKTNCETGVGRPYHKIVSDIAELIQTLLNECGLSIEECEQIGIDSPGMIDSAAGSVVYSGNLHWSNVPLVHELKKHFDLPIKIANDGSCAIYGELLCGGAKGYTNALLLTIGTGIGGGLVCNGQMQEGGYPGGMELGHTLLIMDGQLCTCGRQGCLEAYTTAGALSTQAKNAALENKNSILFALYQENNRKMTVKIPFDAVEKDCSTAQDVLDKYVRYLGEGIINFVNIWRPDIVLIGGGVSDIGRPLIDLLNDYIKTRCFAGERAFVPPIRKALLGNDAGIAGAANL